jgi:hypothetical protein
LYKWNSGISKAEAHGDLFEPQKPPKIFRVLFQNINGIHKDSFHDDSKKLLAKAAQLQPDIAGLNEITLNPAKLAHQDQWHTRVKKAIPGSLTTYAYNTTEPFATDHIAGGVGIIATKEAAVRFKSCSDDPTGLGRWTSVLINGRQDYNVRYVCAYNPNANGNLEGNWMQQERYFKGIGNYQNPLDILQTDLCRALDTWLAAGEHIVLMLDANQDIRTDKLGRAFQSLGLKEAIISKHIDFHPPVPTQQTGSRTIDGIFTTLDLSDARCGYLAFGDGLESDHRMAWLDIPFEVAFGHNPPHLHKANPSRLSLEDPRFVARYHRQVIDGFETHQVFDKVDTLCKMVKDNAPLASIIDLYDTIAMLTRRI